MRYGTNDPAVRRENRQVAMIINNWSAEFRRQYGGVLPDDYFTADIESTGFSRQKDLIVEWGHCQVVGRKVVDKMSILVNWYESDAVSPRWLDEQLARIARQMDLNDRKWRITPQLLQKEGVHPTEAIQFIHDILKTTLANGTLLVMHNGLGFDVPMILASIAQDLQLPFEFPPNSVFDTSAVEKASQILDNPRALPQPGETMHAYFRRISGWRAAGVKHNLDNHCVRKYALDQCPGVDLDNCHTAEQDAYLVHLLFEKYRDLCEQLVIEQAAPAVALGEVTLSAKGSARLREVMDPDNPVGKRRLHGLDRPAVRYRGQRSR